MRSGDNDTVTARSSEQRPQTGLFHCTVLEGLFVSLHCARGLVFFTSLFTVPEDLSLLLQCAGFFFFIYFIVLEGLSPSLHFARGGYVGLVEVII